MSEELDDWSSTNYTLFAKLPPAPEEVFRRLKRVSDLLGSSTPQEHAYRLLFALGQFRMSVGFDREVTVGRSHTFATLSVPDPRLSKAHFLIFKQGEVMKLKDLKSKNGTFVNGQPITECELVAGDLIRAGGMEFAFVPSFTGCDDESCGSSFGVGLDDGGNPDETQRDD